MNDNNDDKNYDVNWSTFCECNSHLTVRDSPMNSHYNIDDNVLAIRIET